VSGLITRRVNVTELMQDAPPAWEDQLRDARILLVDDDPATITFLREVLADAGYTHVADTTDPVRAAALFGRFKPDLVCLDLHMTPLDGFEVLEQLAPLVPRTTYLPILMLTGDSSSAAKQRALGLGARDFVTKPFEVDEVLLRIHNLLIPRFMHLELSDSNRHLEHQVQARTYALEQSRLEVIERLARAVEFRDDETGHHTRRVGRIAGNLAERLGVETDEVQIVSRAAPLHDIGKIGVPDQILLKPAQLSAEEFQIMKRHSTIGAEILAGGRSSLIRMAAQIAQHHHERWDGSGYPDGLSGEAIPLPARIVAVADVFDALTHPRPYRAAWQFPDVVKEIRRQSGAHFDPDLVQAFLELSPTSLV
jgi:putative nucleotidyltransferase with HDIG domain